MNAIYNYNILNDIFEYVCYSKGYDPVKVKLLNKKREKELVEIRQITMAVYKKYRTDLSLANIGAFFGQDHATVLHACKSVLNHRQVERKYNEFVDDVEKYYCKKYKNIKKTGKEHDIFDDEIPLDRKIWNLVLFGIRT